MLRSIRGIKKLITNSTCAVAVVATVLIASGCKKDMATGTSTESGIQSNTNQPLGAPTWVSALPGDQKAILTWTAVSGATSYSVIRSQAGSSGTTVSSPTSNTFTDTGLTNGTIYTYTLRTNSVGGQSGASSSQAVTPSGAAPGSPGNFKISLSAPGELSLVWDSVSGATSYTVYRGTTASSLSKLKNQAATALKDSGLTPDQVQYYQVSATGSAGEGAKSAVVSAIPQGVPAAPKNLKASFANSKVTITWDASASAIKYKLSRYKNVKDEPLVVTDNIAATAVSVADTSVASDGSTYSYYLTVSNAVAESSQAGPATVTVDGGGGKISYDSSPLVWVIDTDQSMAAKPTGLSGCKIAPLLPAGLSLSDSCTIAGKSSATQDVKNYALTAKIAATNSNYEGTISLQITEPAPAVAGFTVSGAVGQAVSFTPTSTAGKIRSCEVTPALTGGLSLNATTCEISGTPTAVQTNAAFTLTAKNTGGSAKADFKVNVSAEDKIVDFVHSCAYTQSGKVYCWGQKAWMGKSVQIVDDSTKEPLTGVTALAFSGTELIQSGNETYCALLSGGAVTCWKAGAFGSGDMAIPVPISGVAKMVAIPDSEGGFCFLMSVGELKCLDKYKGVYSIQDWIRCPIPRFQESPKL